jgi:hypothetical protein
MPDDFALAMIAGRCHHVDGALEAIKDVRCPIARNFECLVIFVSAMFAFGHNFLLLSYISFWLDFVAVEKPVIN